VLGFAVYPTLRRKEAGTGTANLHPKTGKGRGKKKNHSKAKDDPLLIKQGMSRAMFAVFLAAAVAFGFFSLVLPS